MGKVVERWVHVMKYTYYAYVPIGGHVMETTCLVRHRPGVFEKYVKGKWVDAPQFFSILVGADDDFEEIEESLAKKIIDEGKLQ